MPVCSASDVMPYALSMPARVMSIEVDPPALHLELRNPGGDGFAQAEALLAGGIPRVLRVTGSLLPERGEGDLRAAILEDLSPRVRLPQTQPLGLFAQRPQRRGLLLVGQIVGIDGEEVFAVMPQIPRAARGQQVQRDELCSICITELCDELRSELRLIAARDDSDVDQSEQSAQLCGDTRIDRALGWCEGVIEIESDQTR